MRLAGGSPQADLRGSPRGQPLRRVPNRNPLQTQGLPTSRITTREAPHNQNYDQGGSPQAELQPGSLPTSRITTKELAGWLAGRITTREPIVRLAGWLAGWGGGWLAEAQRGPRNNRKCFLVICIAAYLQCSWFSQLWPALSQLRA